ncbi:MAG: UDP-N-acetylmuramyl peptide synthase, partial [Treponema sp.]|nr:UDP-N-acetylmuramyl peptide synthase [Treponema sp.]
MTKLLSQILPSFKNQVVTVDGQEIKDLEDIHNIPISSLVFDSREVKKDSLFFALPGTHVDGNLYI